MGRSPALNTFPRRVLVAANAKGDFVVYQCSLNALTQSEIVNQEQALEKLREFSLPLHIDHVETVKVPIRVDPVSAPVVGKAIVLRYLCEPSR